MRKTVFIVDDVGINLSVAKSAIGNEFTVVTVSSAKKALALLEKIPAHLMLLDIAMPEISGIEMYEIMKANDKFKDIPVIFLTAMVNEEQEKAARQGGAADFMQKPFEPKVLLEKVRRVLE